jgi:hypothetical protein
VSRIPYPIRDAIERHAFYTWLIQTQHYSPPARSAPLSPATWKLPLFNRTPASYTPLTPAQIAAARRDARRLDIGWVLVWFSNPAIAQYLADTGFRYSYRADGVSVYRPAAR